MGREMALTFSVLDHLRRMYPRRPSLWTILTLRLYMATSHSGLGILMPFLRILATTEGAYRMHRLPVLR